MDKNQAVLMAAPELIVALNQLIRMSQPGPDNLRLIGRSDRQHRPLLANESR